MKNASIVGEHKMDFTRCIWLVVCLQHFQLSACFRCTYFSRSGPLDVVRRKWANNNDLTIIVMRMEYWHSVAHAASTLMNGHRSGNVSGWITKTVGLARVLLRQDLWEHCVFDMIVCMSWSNRNEFFVEDRQRRADESISVCMLCRSTFFKTGSEKKGKVNICRCSRSTFFYVQSDNKYLKWTTTT